MAQGAVGYPEDAFVADDQIFRCPADDELYPAVGSSYDWRDTADPVTTLAGQSIESVIRSDAVLVFESLPGWHDKGTMNAAMLAPSASSEMAADPTRSSRSRARNPGTAPTALAACALGCSASAMDWCPIPRW